MQYQTQRFLLTLCLGLILFLPRTAQGQDWMGFHSSNYAGINKVHVQPASIADSRFKFYLNLVAFNATISNNYLSLKTEVASDFDNWSNITREDFIDSDKSSDKGAFGNLHAQLPSFMLTLSPKHAIGLSIRSRSMINIDNINEDVAGFIDEWEQNGEVTIGIDEQFDISKLYAQTHSWAEYGLTYARVLLDNDDFFLKAGGTVKILQGLVSGYGFIDNLQFNGVSGNNLDVLNADIQFGYSDNVDIDNIDFTEEDIRERLWGGGSVGFDFGVVYEKRPDYFDFKYDMDGEEGLWRRDLNKYKYKIGFSILDIGGIKYNKSNNSGDITGTVTNLDIEEQTGDVDEIIENLFEFNRGGAYKMSLPTSLMGELDYNAYKGMVYVNFTSFLALKSGQGDIDKSRYLSTVSISPRIEGKYFGLVLPFSYDKLANFNSGVSLRLGPVVVGSRNLISTALGKDVNALDVHFALKWSLPYKKKRDRDNDGVSNRRDECKKVPGVWAFKGCPDSDSDGIEDSVDKCPNEPGVEAFEGCPDTDADGVKDSEDACPQVAGPPELNGCPDQDGDGITDEEDECPEIKGLAELKGCPDTDGDGVIDSKDKCPELAGAKEKEGCPDTDGDGIYDNEDKCPDKAGTIENFGCPYADTDGDGILDKDDKCPELPGIIENQGCPYADTDGDGVIDKEDECPATPGTVENKGCPEIEAEEQEILNTAFDNLEFKTGSSIIAATSYNSLDELSKLLQDKPTWKLLLEGHTDNVGSRSGNIRLSEKRAQSVANYLSKKGISSGRFLVIGHGPDKPIANNATKEGRQRNRRVEMKIIFD